jgi:hypothetical protein
MAFTDHLRTLDPAADPQRGLLKEIDRYLRFLVFRRLGGRPPRDFGYLEDSWDDAMGELVMDAYTATIVGRFGYLKNQMQHTADVDGLVMRDLHFFLVQRQRSANPVGTAVYVNTRASVSTLLADRTLLARSASSSDRLEPGTRLSWNERFDNPDAETDRIRHAVVTAPGASVLIPRLASKSPRLQEGLAQLLGSFKDRDEVAQTLFGWLVSALEELAETHFAEDPIDSSASLTDEQLERLLSTEAPPSDQEQLEAFYELVSTLEETVAALPKQARVRARALVVLQELVDHALARDERKPPTVAELARRMGTTRSSTHNSILVLREAAATVMAGRGTC